MKNTYRNKRISNANLESYITETYGKAEIVDEADISDKVPCLLQSYYGIPNDSDCTLTTFTEIALYHDKNFTDDAWYNQFLKIARRYGYTPDKGTSPFVMKDILDEGLNVKSKWRIIKGLGVTKKAIKESLSHLEPLALSLWSDGRRYYRDHTVTIVGYKEYSTSNKKIFMLAVCDNWNYTVSYIDFNKLSIICSINYI